MLRAAHWMIAMVVTSGCIAPKHTHTKRTLAHEVGPPAEVHPSVLVVKVDGPTVRVTALRVCRGQARDLVEDTLHVTVDTVGASVLPQHPGGRQEVHHGDSGEALIAVISGLATAADIIVNDGKTDIRRVRRPDESVPCPMALRRVVVDVHLPSGLVLSGRTDDTGQVELVIPDSEPTTGELTARAPGMPPRTVAYSTVAAPPN